jgi:hypothetical protein
MNMIRNTMKNGLRLKLAVACALMLAIPPLMANPASREQRNPHGAVWEEWQPLAEGFVARRRVPARLELPAAERRSFATQDRAKPGRYSQSLERLSLWFYTGVPGLYGVSLDELAAGTGIDAGQLHGAAQSGRLSFLNGGRAVSWHYDATLRRLLFAGETYRTFYADGNAYQLRQTQTPDPQRMTERRGNRQVPAGLPTPFREVLHFEEENDLMFFLWLDPSNPDARYWFWDYLYGSSRKEIQVPLHVPNPAGQGMARLRIRLHGFTDLYPGDDHQVFAKLNGMEIGTVLSWDGLKPAEFVADFDQALLNANGENTLTLHGSQGGQVLESIEVEYLRRPVASHGQLWLRQVVGGVQAASGFSGQEIVVIESPVRNAVLRRDVRTYKQADGWAVAFEAKAGSDYLIAEASALTKPVLDAREQARLTAAGNGVDYLIIAPREFSKTAQALAQHRQARHGSVKIAWLDDIYKAFSAGRVDPFAIGRFMNHVRTKWAQAPSVVTLVGKGSLDRKNRMGYGDNFLPVLMTSNPWALAESDARLLGVDDGVAPFAIGRLPITNDAEGVAYVNKLVEHEGQLGNEVAYRAVVVADNPDKGGNFHADADGLAGQLPKLNFSSVTKLYHPKQAVRTSLIQSATWESGLVSYSGHGSTTQLGDSGENFIKTADAAGLNNTSYPVFAALTCAAGSDANPGTRSLASALVLNPQGGAIAALAPTGLSLNADAHTLGSAFVNHLFGGGTTTVGDALAEAKRETSGRIKDFMAPIYSVIGDPAIYAR